MNFVSNDVVLVLIAFDFGIPVGHINLRPSKTHGVLVAATIGAASGVVLLCVFRQLELPEFVPDSPVQSVRFVKQLLDLLGNTVCTFSMSNRISKLILKLVLVGDVPYPLGQRLTVAYLPRLKSLQSSLVVIEVNLLGVLSKGAFL